MLSKKSPTSILLINASPETSLRLKKSFPQGLIYFSIEDKSPAFEKTIELLEQQAFDACILIPGGKNEAGLYSQIWNKKIYTPLLTLTDEPASETSEHFLRQGAEALIFESEIETGRAFQQITGVFRLSYRLEELASRERFSFIGRSVRYLSHEIRNPLTNIDISVSELKSELENETESVKRFLHFIERNSIRINELLTRILNLVRTDDYKFSEISLKAIVSGAVEQAQSHLSKKNIEVRAKVEDILIRADPPKFEKAIYNLLMNAAEACPEENGILMIESGGDSESASLSISDNGRGIEAGYEKLIFEPFYSFNEKSSGLGLSSSVDVINRHGGRIRLAAEPGQTSFIIELPWFQPKP